MHMFTTNGATALAASAAALMLAGCATNGGGAIINSHGPLDTSVNQGLASTFNTSATNARGTGATTADRRRMLADGFSLIEANCQSFFDGAGKSQMWVITAKDSLSVLSTLSTAAVALRDGSDDTVAAIAFFTNAANSGLDLYTRNYLFGAENVEAVRSLTIKAVIAEQDELLKVTATEYGDVVRLLMRNQSRCMPRSIAAMARKAIETSEIDSYVSSNGTGGAAAQGDAAVSQRLGILLGLNGPLSSEQLSALWWLTEDTASIAEATFLQGKLAALPTDVGPFDAAGALKVPWMLQARVHTEFGLLSKTATDDIRKWVTDARTALQGQAAVNAAPPPAPLVPGQPAPPRRVVAIPAAPAVAEPPSRIPSTEIGVNRRR
jgi:hypothetical protein